MAVVGELRVLNEGEEGRGQSSVEWRNISCIYHPATCGGIFKSDPFLFSGETWHLEYRKFHMGIYFYDLMITKEASPRECSVDFKMSFKKSDGTLERDRDYTHTFKASESDDYCNILDCYTLNDYENRSIVFTFLTDGEHRLSLLKSAKDIASNSETLNESSKLVEASTQTESDNYAEKLISDFSHLLDIGEDSDLTVSVKGVKFRLHRGIMGVRTPVFSAMLRHDMKEKATGVVCIDDFEPKVFQAFVRYLYSGMVNELTTDTVFELFALAHMYQVDELKSACLEFIRHSVSVDTFCDVVNLAITYEQGELLRQATDFFAENMGDIVQTVKWMNYLRDHYIQANELIVKAVQINNIKMKKLMDKK